MDPYGKLVNRLLQSYLFLKEHYCQKPLDSAGNHRGKLGRALRARGPVLPSVERAAAGVRSTR